MTRLRPIACLMLLGAEVGATVPVQLPELGLVGPACVTAVEACPPLEPGPAGTAVVTGTFVTERAPLIDLYIVGLDRPIGVTPSHPFYSEDRAAWVGAAKLRAGEHIRTTDGPATIDRIATRATPQTVYNLEVRGAHTFFVSEAKAWVHNACQFTQGAQKKWIEFKKSGQLAERSFPALRKGGEVIIGESHYDVINSFRNINFSSWESGWVRWINGEWVFRVNY